MNSVELLQIEVAASANWRQAEVIQRAFRERGLRCPNCDYPQNAVQFDRDLGYYIHYKIKMHYHLSRYDPHLWSSREPSDRHYSLFFNAEVEAERLRYNLRLIWPCEDCMRRFNPTGKYRRMWASIPKKFPTALVKEFMDE